jgi:hypothetical protein
VTVSIFPAISLSQANQRINHSVEASYQRPYEIESTSAWIYIDEWDREKTWRTDEGNKHEKNRMQGLKA